MQRSGRLAIVCWICILGGSFFSGCANPVTPTGGPNDTTPPVLITEESTQNIQTGFEKQDIRLVYDEWIQLRDAPSQVVISPPLQFNPEITTRGKAVVYAFHEDEILQDNTTYTINFGQAIQDLTEGNPVENFVFVFSTGTYIDSLSVSGQVINAETREPEPDIYVILHHDLSDTAIATLRPAYFAQTDDNGRFNLSYLRQDTFRVYALKDQNLNYRYDQPAEVFGFLSSPLILQPDTTQSITLEASVALAPLAIMDVIQRSNGVVKVVFSRVTDDIGLNATDGPVPESWSVDADTLLIWHRYDDTVSVAIQAEGSVIDTITLRPFIENAQSVRVRVAGSRTLHPDERLRLQASVPLTSAGEIRAMLNDSISVAGCTVILDSTDQRTAFVDCPWEEGGKYRLTLAGNTVRGYFGNGNDSTDLRVSVLARADFGEVRINLSGLDSTVTYLVELLEGQSIVRSAVSEPGASSRTLGFDRLPPAGYRVRIIADANGNNRWDPADFATLSQAERLLLETIEPLRAGWDVDVSITWTD